MNHLLRGLAPISESGWQMLDREARDRLAPALAARRLVDFSGPHGWEHSATNIGRTGALKGAPVRGISALQRRVLPLVELRAEFELALAELRDADRGADDADLAPLDAAAHRIATAENVAVFHGWPGAVSGISATSPHKPISLGKPDNYPRAVAQAVELLLESGVAGPFGLALGPDRYRVVIETAEHGGYPLREHLRGILDGPIVWAPGLSGGIVVSLRGGDFVIDSGQDISIGYTSHDGRVVALYLEQSFSFHAATPEAAVALTAGAARASGAR
ncbi:MAG TPA: family 1 encapsulin nanocompartment shell protein [Solirubrobacteraceae bacterium]|nr:family 1 encapsulin nanocompartment shell protein [Solirubrobacteraceae bacterium]